MKQVVLLGLMLVSFAFSQSASTATVTTATTGESRLDAVLEQGYVRVCTTGDYKPFTFYNPDTGAFEGIDIDLARDLAQDLGVEARFVRTSWPTLMEDFTSGACDIAMGGVSVNLDRQKQAFFSEPYLVDGKTPITRCENVGKFQTVEDINQQGVNVIVNPGGTNEKFARANLSDANITVYDDNVTIFDQIVAGEADVMVTDAVETVLQSNLHPELCAVHPDEPFTYSEKGYLLPRGDEVWKAWVDQWLHLTTASGDFKEIYDRGLR